MDALERLRLNYRPVFLRYLPRREETALHGAYELGRTAMVDGVSLLDLVQVHHDTLFDVLQQSAGQDLEGTAIAASRVLA